jgi:CRISPR-associated endoribonuclease Cas6
LKSDFEGSLTAANGYLLLSAIKHALRETILLPLFHNEEKKKFFTISCVVPLNFWSSFINDSFKIYGDRFLVDKNDAMSFRITFLYDNHFEQFKECFAPKRMTIGGMGFSFMNIADVCAMDQNDWKQASPKESAKFQFISPVGFKNSGKQNILPTPFAVFNSLMAKWNSAFGEELLESYCKNINLNRIMVDSFDIKTNEFKLKDGLVFRGCVGSIAYDFREMNCEDEKRALSWLSKFAFFSGIGYKTTQGMGQAIVHI